MINNNYFFKAKSLEYYMEFEKKVLFAGWGANNESDFYMYQMWRYTLEKVFTNLIPFDTKQIYFQLGKKKMNKNLLSKIEKEKPEILIVAFFNDELSLKTLSEIKIKFPNLIRVLISCDEDLKYDNFYKFMSLFFDYLIVSQPITISKYNKDGFTNLFQHYDYNTFELNPLNIEKKYDVTFIGRPKADRAELTESLLNEGIDVTLFGWDWDSYPNLQKIYKGPLSAIDYNKVINQSKINIVFSKAGYEEESGLYNWKGKAFEVPQTASFQLVEYYPTILNFFNEDEVGVFKTKEEFIEKVKYYLKNEKEREKMAQKAYKKLKKEYDREKDLKMIFSKILSENEHRDLPEIKKKVITLSRKDLQNIGKSKKKIEDFDYITFNIGANKVSKFKDHMQAFSLDKSEKEISCCDYYVYSHSLGDIALFRGDWAFRRVGNEANQLVDINQLMVRKAFFINHFQEFINLANNKNFNLINEENTIFVSIPLIRIKKLRTIDFEDMKKAFEIRFTDKILSLVYQKRLFFSLYPYGIIGEYLLGNKFILQYLINATFDKKIWDKLMLNQKYMGRFLKIFVKDFK